MAYELIYTSVPRGLKPGSRGFSTVAFTEGMPANYVQTCEGISGYTHAFPPQDPNYSKNPVAFSHYRFRLGGQMFSILSRVGAYGTDYSERSNKLAHHVMASEAEHVAAGPAWAMTAPDFFLTAWKQEPHLIKTARKLRDIVVASCRAEQWQRRTGDAGWAGAIAQRFLNTPKKSVFIIFQPGYDLLPLVAEVTALLPPDKRWVFTFNTYFTALPQGTDCFLRCCLPTGEGLKMSRRSPDALILDLTGSRQLLTEESPLIEAARTGVMPALEKLPRATHVSSPPLQEAQPDVHKQVRRKITVSYESNIPRAPVIQSQTTRNVWLVPIAAVAICLLLGFMGIILSSYIRKIATTAKVGPIIEKSIPSSSPTNLITTTLSSNLTLTSKSPAVATALKTNTLGTNNTSPVTALTPPIKPRIADKETKMTGVIESILPIKFICGSPIKDTKLVASFCDANTYCTLYDLKGKIIKDIKASKMPMGDKYKFKFSMTSDKTEEIEADRKAGSFMLSLSTTNISLLGLSNESGKLFIIISPITMTFRDKNIFILETDKSLCNYFSENIKSSFVTIALANNTSITTNFAVPIVIQQNAFNINLDKNDSYNAFLKSCPAAKKMEGLHELQESLIKNTSVLDCIPENGATRNFIWKLLSHYPSPSSKVNANLNDKTLKGIIMANAKPDKEDKVTVDLRAFFKNFTDEISHLASAITSNDAESVKLHHGQSHVLLTSYIAQLERENDDKEKSHLRGKING